MSTRIACYILFASAVVAQCGFARAQEAADAADSAATDAPAVTSSLYDGCGANSCACNDGCCGDNCAEWCDSYNGRRRLFGFLPSDHCFDRFISPISNPFFFEDPRSLTEARVIYLDNSLPNSLGNGDAQAWSAQFRGRVTDRWSIIAPRLAYFSVNQASGGDDAPRGFLSAPVGAKVNLVRDVDRQFLVSAGMTYFIPGSSGAYANFGNGDFHLFLTGGKQIFGRGHWLSASGFRLPEDRNFGTQMWYWSNQWDYELPGHIYPLIGLNWFHWIDSAGIQSDIPLTGVDLLNLPANNVAGSNLVTNVIGGRWKPGSHLEVGFGWEYPLTGYTDIYKNRVYTDLIIRY